LIFVTVGGQMPFDRLVRAVDEWAGATGRSDVFAQIGPAKFKPRHIEFASLLSPDEFRQHVSECSEIVGHAGMGTILTALELGKPLLVLPRLARLNETRSDHQKATAKHFQSAGLVLAAADETELTDRLGELPDFHPATEIGACASTELIMAVRSYALGR
jgi:UDP-N-acetylglucosamine transferase subunit ALG13